MELAVPSFEMVVKKSSSIPIADHKSEKISVLFVEATSTPSVSRLNIWFAGEASEVGWLQGRDKNVERTYIILYLLFIFDNSLNIYVHKCTALASLVLSTIGKSFIYWFFLCFVCLLSVNHVNSVVLYALCTCNCIMILEYIVCILLE